MNILFHLWLNTSFFSNDTTPTVQEEDVPYEVSIPFVPKTAIIDFMIEIEGSTMNTKYKAGDIVACSIVDIDDFIQWKRVHVVATKSQGILFKRINESANQDYLAMIYDYTKYASFEVLKSEIISIALVVGLVRQV